MMTKKARMELVSVEGRNILGHIFVFNVKDICANKCFRMEENTFKHKKLQVRKVTERNSINIDDITKLDKNDDNGNNNGALKQIVAIVRDYKYNGTRAITLLRDKLPHKRRRMASFHNEVEKEICKWCGRSIRTPD